MVAKDRIIGIGLLIVGIITGLLICEMICRGWIFPPPQKQSPWCKHKVFGWFHTPNQDLEAYGLKHKRWGFHVKLKFNSKGLRDFEYPYKKNPGNYRILALGDSYVEGVQVPLESTFVKLLEKDLNINNKRRVEVINGGVAAYSTVNEYLYLVHEGLKYQPDMVLLCFFMGNDVYGNSQILKTKNLSGSRLGPYFVIEDGDLKLHYSREDFATPSEADSLSRFGKIKGFLSNHSKFYLLLTQGIKNIYPLAIFLERVKVLERTPFPDEFNVFSTHYSPEWEQAWEITQRILLKIKKELNKKGINFQIVIIPFQGEVNPDLWKKMLKVYQVPKDAQWSLDRPNQILVDFCQQHQIKVIDLKGAFKEDIQRTKRPLHYKYDGHFDEEGHYLAAKVIYQNLQTD